MKFQLTEFIVKRRMEQRRSYRRLSSCWWRSADRPYLSDWIICLIQSKSCCSWRAPCTLKQQHHTDGSRAGSMTPYLYLNLNPYLNLIFCFRMCSIHASMNAVVVILRAWTRASSESGATLSRTWPITVCAAREAYSLGLTGKPVQQKHH